jgi:hypothetical protein
MTSGPPAPLAASEPAAHGGGGGVDHAKRAQHEWERVSTIMASVVGPFDERPEYSARAEARPASERAALRRIAGLPPSTRSYAEVRQLLNLLRGADLLLKLNDDDACAVAGSMRLCEFSRGELICSEHNAADGFLLVVEGACTVLVRDLSVSPPRAPLFHLFEGDSFSEAALIENARRAPSLVASQTATAEDAGGGTAVLLRVSKEDFLASSAAWALELLERKIVALSAVPCFLREERRMLRPLAEVRAYARIRTRAHTHAHAYARRTHARIHARTRLPSRRGLWRRGLRRVALRADTLLLSRLPSSSPASHRLGLPSSSPASHRLGLPSSSPASHRLGAAAHARAVPRQDHTRAAGRRSSQDVHRRQRRGESAAPDRRRRRRGERAPNRHARPGLTLR